MKLLPWLAGSTTECNKVCDSCGGTLETRHLPNCGYRSADQMAIEQIWRAHERNDPRHYDKWTILGFVNVGKLTCWMRMRHDWDFCKYGRRYSAPYYSHWIHVCRRCGTEKREEYVAS